MPLLRIGSLVGLCAFLAMAACSATAKEPAATIRLKLPAEPDKPKSPQVQCVVSYGPALPISALSFNPDGKLLAAGGYGEVLLWDLENAKLARRIGGGELAGMVQAVAFHDGGKTLAVGYGTPRQSGGVKLFAVEDGALQATLDAPPVLVACMALAPDGVLLAAGGEDGKVRIWNLPERKLVKTLDAHQATVRGAVFSPDGKRLATASGDKTLLIWQTDTWETVLRYDLPAAVQGAAFGEEGQVVVGAVGGPEEWALRIARVEADIEQSARRKPTPRQQSTGTGMPLAVVWPEKTDYAVVACNDGTLRAYQIKGSKQLATFTGHSDWVYGVAATVGGTKIASGGGDGTIHLYAKTDGRPVARLVQLVPGADGWLILTRNGYFDTSSPEAIGWKAPEAKPEDLTLRYRQPAEVKKALDAMGGP